MKRIHIVEPYHSAAMQHMSVPLTELSALYEVTTSTEIDDEADVNIHMPWHSLAGHVTFSGSKHVIAYTHCNPSAEASLIDACGRADLVVAMSYEGRRELIGYGVDPAKIWVNYAAANYFHFRRRLIAIIGYPQPNGRKRESLLFDLAYTYDLGHYAFLFVGAGWEETVNNLASLGVATQTLTAIKQEELQEVYHRVDALLVTGYIEGGPLPLLEAMASGCKVFSPRFGYAADMLEEEDLYDGPGELMEMMDEYFTPAIDNAYLAHAWTWQDYAAEYALMIGRLTGEPVDLYPNRGMSRYAQLLDVIDEIHPQRIVEVGTWSGTTALRMIQQAAKYRRMESICYQGFDLFEHQTADDNRRELSKGGCMQHIIQRRLNATKAGITLIAGYTRDTLPEYLDTEADLYFIDGGHSEETIQNDGQIVYQMKDSAVAIFDDYYTPARAGGGCNKFISSLPRDEFSVIYLPATTQSDTLGSIGMVRVERRKDNAGISLPLRTESFAYAGS